MALPCSLALQYGPLARAQNAIRRTRLSTGTDSQIPTPQMRLIRLCFLYCVMDLKARQVERPKQGLRNKNTHTGRPRSRAASFGRLFLKSNRQKIGLHRETWSGGVHTIIGRGGKLLECATRDLNRQNMSCLSVGLATLQPTPPPFLHQCGHSLSKSTEA
jgi:hypothetical protein